MGTLRNAFFQRRANLSSFRLCASLLLATAFVATAGAQCNLNTASPSVTICSPANNANVTSPVNVVAGTTDNANAVTKMIVYVDNTIAYTVNASQLSTSLSLTNGQHNITVNAWDAGGAVFKTTIYITSSGGTGTAPVSVGVSPSSATLAPGKKEQFTAKVLNTTNTAVTWSVDGITGGNATVGTVTTGGLYTAPSASGTHHVIATSQANTGKSDQAAITVIAGGCAATAPAPSINICSPTAGATVSSPTTVSAGANSTGTISKFNLYDNNVLRYTTAGSTMSTSITLTNGSHNLVFQFLSNGVWTKKSETVTVGAPPPPGAVPVTTYHNDQARTGLNPNEKTLNLSNVNQGTFGKKYSFPVDGQIYAQPLYLPNVTIGGVKHNVVFVATENDTVYAFDADGTTTTPLWKVHFGQALSSNDVEGISPWVGITSTPVIDRATNTMYVLSKTAESGKKVYRLHALNVATGAEKFGGSKIVTGSVKGTGRDSVNGTLNLEPSCYQRTGLGLYGNNVYIAFGHCAHGWMLTYNKTTLAQTGIYNTTPDGAGGAFWNSGGAPAFDAAGNMFIISAVDTGDPASGYNDSFLRFGTNVTAGVTDFFMPSNEAFLRKNDADLGSGNLVLVPDNASNHPHELIGGGKDGRIFVINRDNMGKYNTTTNMVLQIVQTGTKQFDNIFDTPGYWNGNIYIHCESDVLKAYSFSTATGMLSNAPTSKSAKNFGVHGATVSISSNGNSDAIVWEIESTGEPNGNPAILHAYDATDVSKELYNSSQAGSRDTAGPAVKFVVPTVTDGKVFVGTANRLDVYGLL